MCPPTAPTTLSPPSPASFANTRGKTDAQLMQLALQEARNGVLSGEGGPFGAVVARSGVVIARGHNRVLQTNDPTAHAEVVAIRDACAKLGRFSLHDCVLYSSCQPCPMCFAAVHWAKLPACFYAATADDAAAVGFDDRFLYDAIQGKAVEDKCIVQQLPVGDGDSADGGECLKPLTPFQVYEKMLAGGQSSLY
jgi:guanine deaminase